uniref:NADH dehydrogenase [ubiquinone] 1 alpha subcomplex subunit 11 n=1 Tax=Otus sunia TaxID=257818 RepID=A0A8C8BC05_9STRI
MAGYWDGPEGEECPRRTWLTTRVGAAAGEARGTRGFVLVFCLLFTATLGAVFGVTTCLSAQIREEPDSPLDYFIGGCATGAVLGARAHSYMTGTTACLGLGVTAALFKIGNKEGWRLTGPPKL